MSLRDELEKELRENFYDVPPIHIITIFQYFLSDNNLKIVPVEPTEEMCFAASEYAADSDDLDDIFELIIQGRKAMLEAAPNYLEKDNE